MACVAVAVACTVQATGALGDLELRTIDARFALRGGHPARPDVVIVALDAESLAALGRRPPLPRGEHARLLRRLHQAGARLVAYDFQFIGPSTRRADDDLRRAISTARPVVLATHDTDRAALPVPAGERDPGRLGATPASVGVQNDSDGRIRHLLYAPVALKSFDVTAAELWRGHPVGESSFADNAAWIDYAGGPGTFRVYSFADVLSGRVGATALRGRLVVVGATDPIEKDVFAVPVSNNPMAGAEIHANAIATVLANFPLRSVPDWLDYALTVLFGLAIPLISLRSGPGRGLAAAVAALLGLGILGQVSFDSGWIVAISSPALALALGTLGSSAVTMLGERSERRRMREIFSRFVPPAVVDDVIERTEDDLRLGAVRREGTVIFTDLRGFTTFAEGLEPETVVNVVNEYLTEMSDAIQAHGGTLLAYMGDGILALYGAPLEQPDHADRALDAVREMLGVRLPRFNAWMAREGFDHTFRMGIGVNTGSVMSGNVGSPRRLEYTAIGDTTNTAARLEAMTKGTPHQAFVSAATRAAATRVDDLSEFGAVAVRGRTQTVEVWVPTAPDQPETESRPPSTMRGPRT